MANIDQYIEQIENARYGKDVRDAIVNALNAINTEHHDNNVTSFNSRTGDVLPVNGDYNINQISSQGGLDGQIPVANSNGGFTLRTMHGEIDTLGQLTDVNISSPSDGQVMKYDSINDEWVNDNCIKRLGVVNHADGDTWTTLLKRLYDACNNKRLLYVKIFSAGNWTDTLFWVYHIEVDWVCLVGHFFDGVTLYTRVLSCYNSFGVCTEYTDFGSKRNISAQSTTEGFALYGI